MFIPEEHNYNPKRLVTFYRRRVNMFKQELEQARLTQETDYVCWLERQIERDQEKYDKKRKKLNFYIEKVGW